MNLVSFRCLHKYQKDRWKQHYWHANGQPHFQLKRPKDGLPLGQQSRLMTNHAKFVFTIWPAEVCHFTASVCGSDSTNTHLNFLVNNEKAFDWHNRQGGHLFGNIFFSLHSSQSCQWLQSKCHLQALYPMHHPLKGKNWKKQPLCVHCTVYE